MLRVLDPVCNAVCAADTLVNGSKANLRISAYWAGRGVNAKLLNDVVHIFGGPLGVLDIALVKDRAFLAATRQVTRTCFHERMLRRAMPCAW